MSESIDSRHVHDELMMTWAELQLLKGKVERNQPPDLSQIESMIEHVWGLVVLFRDGE